MPGTASHEHSIVNDLRKAFLLKAAERYVWWENAIVAVEYPQKILSQVMNIGVWNDMCELMALFTPQELINVLNKAEIGQFNEKSWHFWYNRLTDSIPPMPKRIL